MSAKVQIGTVFLCKHLCRLHLCYKTSLYIRFSCKTFPKKRFFFHHVAIDRKILSGILNFFTRPHKNFFKQCEDLTRISSARTRCRYSKKIMSKFITRGWPLKKQLSEHCLVFSLNAMLNT